MAKRLGLRLGFLASSVFAFTIGWISLSFVFIACAVLGYYRFCGIVRNAWCGILPYKFWSECKPSEYESYTQHLKLRLKASLRFLFFKETLADISIQDSFQVNFSDFFLVDKDQSSDQNCGINKSQYSNLYGDWKEGNSNEWKLSK
jgi:hypothetical protein